MANVSNGASNLTENDVCGIVDRDCDVCDIVDKKCEKGIPTGGKMIALIVVIYFIVFLVWGVYALFDFINERWKSMKSIYFAGKVQSVVLFITMPIAVLYIVNTAAERDYPEMCAACVALIFFFYYWLRTVWGMVQLVVLRRWVRLALQVMHFQGYHLCADPMSDHTDGRFFEKVRAELRSLTERHEAPRSEELIARVKIFNKKLPRITLSKSDSAAILQKVVNHHVDKLSVNNSIVDNEFVEMENPFHLNGLHIFDKSEPLVCPLYPDQCLLRWSVLYLASYGIPFLQDSTYCRSLVQELDCSFVPNYFVKCVFTQAMLIGNTDDRRSPGQQATWESTWATIVLCRTEALFASLQDSSCMPLRKMDIEIRHGVYFERFIHRLSRLVDNVPLERIDLKSNGQRSNSKAVGLVSGITHQDIENFVIFLHSSPLHSVDLSTTSRTPNRGIERLSVNSLQFVKVFIRAYAEWLYDICPWVGRRSHRTFDVEDPELPNNSGSTEPEIDLCLGTSRFRNVKPFAIRGQNPDSSASSIWTRALRRVICIDYFTITDQPVKYNFNNEDMEFSTVDSNTDTRSQYPEYTFRRNGMRRLISQYYRMPFPLGRSFSDITDLQSSDDDDVSSVSLSTEEIPSFPAEKQLEPWTDFPGETSAQPDQETTLLGPEIAERSESLPHQPDSQGMSRPQERETPEADQPTDPGSSPQETTSQSTQEERVVGTQPATAEIIPEDPESAAEERSATVRTENEGPSETPIGGSQGEEALGTQPAGAENTESAVQGRNVKMTSEDRRDSAFGDEPFLTNEPPTALSSQVDTTQGRGSQNSSDSSGDGSGQQIPSDPSANLEAPSRKVRFARRAAMLRTLRHPEDTVPAPAQSSVDEQSMSSVPIEEEQGGSEFDNHKRLLQMQARISDEKWDRILDLPTFRRCENRLRSVQWNSRVPIVSVIIDNIYAVVSGNRYCKLLRKSNVSEQESTILIRKIKSHNEENPRGDKLQQANRAVQESVIKSGLAGPDSSGIRGFQKLRFSGASMRDIVKTANNGDGDLSRFSLNQYGRRAIPRILIDPERKMRFPVSGMLQDAARILVHKGEPFSKVEKKSGRGERYALESRMIWECQKHLHENYAQPVMEERSHLHFALLIVLSFPTLATRISVGEDGFTLSLSVEPLLAPQAVSVNISIKDDLSHIEMKFTAPKKHNYLLRLSRGFDRPDHGELILTEDSKQGPIAPFEFECEDWISAFQGRMKAFNPDPQSLKGKIIVKSLPQFSVTYASLPSESSGPYSLDTEEGDDGGQEFSDNVESISGSRPDEVSDFDVGTIPLYYLPDSVPVSSLD